MNVLNTALTIKNITITIIAHNINVNGDNLWLLAIIRKAATTNEEIYVSWFFRVSNIFLRIIILSIMVKKANVFSHSNKRMVPVLINSIDNTPILLFYVLYFIPNEY